MLGRAWLLQREYVRMFFDNGYQGDLQLRPHITALPPRSNALSFHVQSVSYRSALYLVQRAISTAVLLLIILPNACFPWTGKVVEVVRGDWIKVKQDNGKVETVRLYGIHSPGEIQTFGKTATLYTTQRVLGRMVEVKPFFRDQFDRVIAWVFVEGECLNKELLKRGMTWWYRKFVPFETGLGKLEEDAMQARAGLWADPHPTPPWEFNDGLPPGVAGASENHFTTGRRGSVAEAIKSETGPARNLFGKQGSVREKLLRGPSPEDRR